MDRTVLRKVKSLLLDGEYVQLIDLCDEDRSYWKALRQCLFALDEDLRWPAIEATALLMQRWWQRGRKAKVRDYMNRLMWSLNDESGEIGWSAPETIAATIRLIPELLDPFGSMMLDRALQEPPLVNGGLWGIGHIGTRMCQTAGLFQDALLELFTADDPQTLGLAAWATGEAAFAPALPPLEALKSRAEPVRIHIDGRFEEKPLGQWATEAADKICRTTR